MDSKTQTHSLKDEDAVKIPGCSLIECHLPTDVILESSDNVRFGAHKLNLEMYSAGFPPAASTPFSDEIVHMPENAAVLKLLLHYMHNERQPDSTSFTFDVLAPLSEAVEKYMVFSAMEVCRLRMRDALPDHPLEVLAYAVKHEYPLLAKLAAPLTISVSLDNVKKTIKGRPDIVLQWVEYREHWLKLRNFIFENPPVVQHPGGVSTCERWDKFHRKALLEMGGKIDKLKLQQFSFILQETMAECLDECYHCQIRATNWKMAIEKRLGVPPVFGESA